MARRIDDGTGEDTLVPGSGLTQAHGTTVPPDGAVGFAHGCVFHKLDGTSALDTLYVNVGTQASANFDPVANAAAAPIADAGGFTNQTTVEAALAEIYQDLLSANNSIVLPLSAWREVTSGGDVANIAGNGGVLASDTTPTLQADAVENWEIVWAAAVVDPIALSISLPFDLDDTAAIVLDLFVKTDNAGGGGIEAATFTVHTNFDGGAQVTDTATDSTPAQTLHTIGATIAASDVPENATTLTIALTPGTHANDPVHLCGARLRYKRRLLTS